MSRSVTFDGERLLSPVFTGQFNRLSFQRRKGSATGEPSIRKTAGARG
ncbi:MAG: hypothetical protein V3T84_16715 [Phycisphaerales bacterium]